MIQGFRLLDQELGLSARRGAPFQIDEVRFGFEPARSLRITLGDTESLDHILIEDPTSHRVQDERDMLDYWSARSGEGVGKAAMSEQNRASTDDSRKILEQLERELECDEDEARFEETVKKVAKAPPAEAEKPE